MKSLTRQYIFGLLFLGVGIYELATHDYLEAALYSLAGLSFVFNTLALEPKLASQKKILVIITWVFIILTALLFLYLIQFKYL